MKTGTYQEFKEKIRGETLWERLNTATTSPRLDDMLNFAYSIGKHIQFNVVSREMMMEAKKEPEKHRDLIVRVAGYSAYWTDLTPTIHDELILRSENEWEI